jgi:hypothetical protein
VPAESERLRRRVSRRDLWFIGGVASLAVALTPVAVVLSERGHHAPRAGCKTVIVAGFMGGETHTVCASQP